MRLLRLLSVSVLALGMGLTSADAQSFRGSNGPAEQPPASYTGKQYVDSRGCVYIRAGYGGRVTWVPRVTRDRKQICGARSSVAPKTQTAKAAPKTTRTTKAVRGKPPAGAQVISRQVKVIPAAPKPKTQTRVVRRAATPAPQQQVKTGVVRRQVQPAPQARAQQGNCRAASSFSQQFVNKGARCGPQGAPARSVVREELSPQSRNRAGQGRTGPQGVNRRIQEASIQPPKGYKRAFDDGRLNPLRGVATSSGQAQMGLIWSNTVPRYLIDPATGKRATRARRKALGLF